jgi:hypothetical protein
LPITIFGQSDSLSKERLEKVLAGLKNRFSDFTKNVKLTGVPKRLFVGPGLLGQYDELHIWGDTTYVYSSYNNKPLDSSQAIQFVNSWDQRLKEIFGDKYVRSVEAIDFNREGGWPITFEYENIKVAIGVAKFEDRGYLTTLAFTSTIPIRHHSM